MNVYRWTALVLVSTALASAQKREDFLQIQRDVAQLQDQVRQFQKTQEDKIAALTALVQQSLDASAKLAGGLGQMQIGISDTLAQQQQKVVAPVAALGKEVEQMSGDFRSVQTGVNELGGQLARLDSKLADISSAIRVLSARPVEAPPAAPPPAAATEPQPPPGLTAESLFDTARRDFSAKRDELAFQGFTDYLKYFGKTDLAPRAQYFRGMIYDRAEQYDDALKSFDDILERFPENPATPDSLYMKGVVLMKAKKNAEARDEFNDFLKRYPSHDNAPKAKQHLKEISGVPPAKPTPGKRR